MFVFHRTSVNYLLVNLAVADMTVGIFLAPGYIFIHTFTHPDGVAGNVLCKLLTGGTLGWVGASATIFSLVAIAIERYYAVLHPHGNKGRLSKRNIKVCHVFCKKALKLHVRLFLRDGIRIFFSK